MREAVRKESEIFSELAEICASPGYVHAIASLCYQNDIIGYADTLTPEDMLQQLSRDILVRTEISTLVGLACKKQLNIDLPSPEVIRRYIDKTDSLLKEIHQSMMPPMEYIFNPNKIGDQNFNPFRDGLVLREAIFYGGESAYDFQYRDLSKIKYEKDNNWFLTNKGFSIQQVIDVMTSIKSLRNDKANNVVRKLFNKDPSEWTVLSVYKFTAKEISDISNIEIDTVKLVIESFVSSINMDEFNSLDDFNPKNAYPIIQLPEDEYLLFQIYSLVQALYETPFFWFNDDKAYKNIANQHRGQFTENFSAERLKLVFGEKRVFSNIDIYNSKEQAGEIDVLVVFADRAIILQAKSKKLTIPSRKGNDNSLQSDFKKAIQEAYDQAYLCATLLNDKKYKLVDKSGKELNINREYKEIYPFCVISEHYPALSFQARQFLEFQETKNIKPPFVMDVFLLDVMTEMLQSPLHFLSYVNKRISYGDKILSTHELTILSYHLKQNLWIDNKYAMMQIGDDICVDLDLAMLTRRDGAPGSDTPEGILTKYKGTVFDQIIRDIDKLEHSAIISLGFTLLSMSSDAIEMINNGIAELIKRGRKDGQHHDLTLEISEGGLGLTIHCNDDHKSISGPRLESHCERRKYTHKASSWFGICIGQKVPRLRFGVNKEYDWVQSNEMDELVQDLPKPQNLKGNNKINFAPEPRQSKKIGRNEKCPCGSGKKYKKCCLKQEWRM
ncbi:MAG: SEC-C metal-binding domain-containing protein [Nostoc sp. DedSLP03]|uniref:SEC-C metal-binding domain-containing protein n=1 Tax=Nostoc sp. DedSLP03 TaxID=3075400 RepID=UPI002AD30FDB|nr:SEC-C metal-binding domain-containing protein [Nostoc sp. DedSLP03]MDZ7968456.1 SEC-C metal-binding domain-containing protein [Nostoc sp. DedSLP03]